MPDEYPKVCSLDYFDSVSATDRILADTRPFILKAIQDGERRGYQKRKSEMMEKDRELEAAVVVVIHTDDGRVMRWDKEGGVWVEILPEEAFETPGDDDA